MKLDKRDLYDGLDAFESDLSQMLSKLQTMKQSIQELVEKNTELELENQKLREHLREMNQTNPNSSKKMKQALSTSRKILKISMKKAFTYVMTYMVQEEQMMNRVPFV